MAPRFRRLSGCERAVSAQCTWNMFDGSPGGHGRPMEAAGRQLSGGWGGASEALRCRLQANFFVTLSVLCNGS